MTAGEQSVPSYVPAIIAEWHGRFMNREGFEQYRAVASRLVFAPKMRTVYERLSGFGLDEKEWCSLYWSWTNGVVRLSAMRKEQERDAAKRAKQLLKEATKCANRLQGIIRELEQTNVRINGPLEPHRLQSEYRLIVGRLRCDDEHDSPQKPIKALQVVIECASANTDLWLSTHSQKTSPSMWREYLVGVNRSLGGLNFLRRHRNQAPVNLRETDWLILVNVAIQPSYPISRGNLADALQRIAKKDSLIDNAMKNWPPEIYQLVDRLGDLRHKDSEGA